MSEEKSSPPLVAVFGLLSLPFMFVGWLKKLASDARDRREARAWADRVVREGFACPLGHVRAVAETDRYKCAACHAVLVGILPWARCYCCGAGVPVSFIDCDECGASIPLPPALSLIGGHHG